MCDTDVKWALLESLEKKGYDIHGLLLNETYDNIFFGLVHTLNVLSEDNKNLEERVRQLENLVNEKVY